MKDQKAPNLSVVIVYVNGPEVILNCLNSLYNTIKKNRFEVILIGNQAPAKDLRILKNKYPEMKIITTPFRFGLSQASNLGLKEAKGKFILWSNPDVVILPGAINLLLEFLEGHPEVGIVGPKILNPDGSFQPCFTDKRINLFTEFLERFGVYKILPFFSVMESWKGKENFPHFTKQVSGAYMMFRRELLFDVGFLDEKIFLYYEEFDYCYRALERGWKMYYLPEAKIIHIGGQSIKSLDTERQKRCALAQVKSKLYFFKKHYGDFSEKVLTGVLIGSSLFKFIGSQIISLAVFDSVKRKHYRKLASYHLKVFRLCFRRDRADASKLPEI